jgi:hypothetical protein
MNKNVNEQIILKKNYIIRVIIIVNKMTIIIYYIFLYIYGY